MDVVQPLSGGPSDRVPDLPPHARRSHPGDGRQDPKGHAMTTYGYRYAAGSHVFELIGRDRDTAASIVTERRAQQTRNQTPPTVELVEHTADGWQPVQRETADA